MLKEVCKQFIVTNILYIFSLLTSGTASVGWVSLFLWRLCGRWGRVHVGIYWCRSGVELSMHDFHKSISKILVRQCYYY
jgi:hypothetical protein